VSADAASTGDREIFGIDRRNALLTGAAALVLAIAPALLATLVYRVFTLWLPVIPTLALLPQVRFLDRELPLVPRAQGS
jgi:hypothetical protein